MSLGVGIVLGMMFVGMQGFFGCLYWDGKIREELKVRIWNE